MTSNHQSSLERLYRVFSQLHSSLQVFASYNFIFELFIRPDQVFAVGLIIKAGLPVAVLLAALAFLAGYFLGRDYEQLRGFKLRTPTRDRRSVVRRPRGTSEGGRVAAPLPRRKKRARVSRPRRSA